MQFVIIGAGKIGRGFVGRLFSAAGYELVVVEIDQPLIDALNARHSYTVRLVDSTGCQDVVVGPVSVALHAESTEAVADAISRVSVMATSVGARKLPRVAPNIAAGIRRRIEIGNDDPLDCLLCENLYNAGHILHDLVLAHLDPAEQAFCDNHVGFVNAVIGCMGPPIPSELRQQDPGLVLAEPYHELPIDADGLLGSPPPVQGIEVCHNFEVYTARKLFIHNCGHAALAYLGYLKGHVYAHDAVQDPAIRQHLEQVWQEGRAGLVGHYAVEPAWIDELVSTLPRRFANQALGDTLFRLGRDPIRKLKPADRLLGPTRLAEKAGITPHALARTIAAALCFDPPQDPLATILQEMLQTQGIDHVLASICEIQPNEALAVAIKKAYIEFKDGHIR